MTGPAPIDFAHALTPIHEDAAILVVAKAAGVAVHPGGTDHLPSLIELLPAPLFPIHRLDIDTSGVLLFARSAIAAAALGRSFADGKVEKRYLTLVAGVAREKGIIRRPLLEAGREFEAITRYRTLAVLQGGMRCSASPPRSCTACATPARSALRSAKSTMRKATSLPNTGAMGAVTAASAWLSRPSHTCG